MPEDYSINNSSIGDGQTYNNPYERMSTHEILNLESDIAEGKQAEPSKRKSKDVYGEKSQYDLYQERLKKAKEEIAKQQEESEKTYNNIQKDIEKYNGENKPAPEIKKPGEGYDVPVAQDGSGIVKPPEGTVEPNKSSEEGQPAEPGDCGKDSEGQKNDYSKSQHLGATARLFETGNSNTNGAGMISTGKGDHGGPSYGMYQLPSKQRPAPVSVFLKQTKWRQMFEGLEPATPEFNKKWKEVAASEPEEFAKAQEEYNRKSDFDPMVRKLKGLGIDINNSCFGLQELAYSTATQFGPSGGYKVFSNALQGKDVSKMTNLEIINAVYAEKSQVSKWFKSSSKSVQNGVYSRYQRESKINAEQCCGAGVPLGECSSDDLILDQAGSVLTSGGQAPCGFMDPELVYPLNTRLNEPDFSRLARGISAGTLVDIKNAARVLKIPEDVTEGSTWDEPASGYAAQYPDNIVWQTHGGVTMELDSTKNRQRFHIWHPSNSFLEIYPSGQWVEKNSGDKYEIVLGNKRTYIAGDNHVTVSGTNNIVYRSPQRDFYEKNKTSEYKENHKIYVEGNQFSHTKLNYEHHTEGNELYKIEQDREVFIAGNDGKITQGNEQNVVNGNKMEQVHGKSLERVLQNKVIRVEDYFKMNVLKNSAFISELDTTIMSNTSSVSVIAKDYELLYSYTDMKIGGQNSVHIQSNGIITLEGSGIILKNSCDGVVISARCWDVKIEGSCSITAPVIELNGLVKIPQAEIGNLNVGSCNLNH